MLGLTERFGGLTAKGALPAAEQVGRPVQRSLQQGVPSLRNSNSVHARSCSTQQERAKAAGRLLFGSHAPT